MTSIIAVLDRATCPLGTPAALIPQTTSSANIAVAPQVDINGNAGVTQGTGSGAVFNLSDPKGNPILSGPAGLVAPNASMGTAATLISSVTTVSPSVNSGISAPVVLFYAQATDSSNTASSIGYLYIQPGTNGGSPTVSHGTIADSSGNSVAFGPSVSMIAGPAAISGSTVPGAINIWDQQSGTLSAFSISPAADGLSFAKAGSSTVSSFTSGVTMGQSSLGFTVVSSTANETGIYFIPKLANGGLGAATVPTNGYAAAAGINIGVVDLSGNPYLMNQGAMAEYLASANVYTAADGPSFMVAIIPGNTGQAVTAFSPILGTTLSSNGVAGTSSASTTTAQSLMRSFTGSTRVTERQTSDTDVPQGRPVYVFSPVAPSTVPAQQRR